MNFHSIAADKADIFCATTWAKMMAYTLVDAFVIALNGQLTENVLKIPSDLKKIKVINIGGLS